MSLYGHEKDLQRKIFRHNRVMWFLSWGSHGDISATTAADEKWEWESFENTKSPTPSPSEAKTCWRRRMRNLIESSWCHVANCFFFHTFARPDGGVQKPYTDHPMDVELSDKSSGGAPKSMGFPWFSMKLAANFFGESPIFGPKSIPHSILFSGHATQERIPGLFNCQLLNFCFSAFNPHHVDTLDVIRSFTIPNSWRQDPY